MIRALMAPLAAVLLLAGCSSRDVRTDLEIVEVRTGWYDMGVTETGENKLVPSISFKLKNMSETPISGVQLDAVFRNQGEEAIIDEHFVPGIASGAPLAAGESTTALVLRSKFGFTSPESRANMLTHSEFVDARVTILGRHGRNNWASMGEFPIERELLE
jgi:hypothetical protein